MKTKTFKIYKGEIKRMEANIPSIEKELKEGRHPTAVLGNHDFTFLDDIQRLCEYLEATGREKLASKLKA